MINNIYVDYGMIIADSKKELRAFILGFIYPEIPSFIYGDIVKDYINNLKIVKLDNGKYAVARYKITGLISRVRELIDD